MMTDCRTASEKIILTPESSTCFCRGGRQVLARIEFGCRYRGGYGCGSFGRDRLGSQGGGCSQGVEETLDWWSRNRGSTLWVEDLHGMCLECFQLFPNFISICFKDSQQTYLRSRFSFLCCINSALISSITSSRSLICPSKVPI